MNRSLALLLGAVVVLGALAAVATREDTRPAPKALAIAGFASAEALEAEQNRGMLDPREEIPSPIDEILVERAGETLHLKRSGEGKESKWALTRPVTASATRFQAMKMVNLFKTATQSVYSTSVETAELGLYDLEPSRRIAVTIKAGGEVWQGANLIIGKVERGESETADESAKSDTWVQAADDPLTVYRISGKDLRAAFEVELSELRDKAVFGVTAEQLVSLAVTAPSGKTISLAGVSTVAPGAPPGAPAAPPKTLWTLTEPAGFEADETVATLARSFSGLRTRRFVAAADAPSDALSGPTWKLKAVTREGVKHELTLTASDTEPLYAKASGIEDLLEIDAYTAKNLRKTLADVRHRGLLTLKAESIEAVTFAPPEEPAYTVKRGAQGWTYSPGKGRAEVDNLLKGLTGVKSSRFAREGELEAAQAALASPDFEAKFETSEGTTILRAGPKMDEADYKGQRWAQVETETASDPFLLQDHMANRFRKTRAEVAWKKIFEGSANAITSIELLNPGQDAIGLKRGEGEGAGLALASVPEGKKEKTSAIGTEIKKSEKVSISREKRRAEPGTSVTWSWRKLSHGAISIAPA